MDRVDSQAVYRLALEALCVEPEGVKRSTVWSKRQAEIRAGARVALRGAIESQDATLENDLRTFLRDEMSACECDVPRDCPKCSARETFLVRMGYEWGSEPAPAAPRLVLVGTSREECNS